MTDEDPYEGRRRRLYAYFFEEFNNQYINYNRYYRASSGLGKLGRGFNYATTVASAVLLALIGAITTSPDVEISGIFPLTVAAITAALAFVNSVGNFQVRSNQYYNAGQQHQNLFEKMEHFVIVRLPDPEEDLKELEEDAARIIYEKDTLNESTPQISSRWYHKVVAENETEWERVPLEDIPGESYEH